MPILIRTKNVSSVAGPGKAKKEFACERGRGLEKFVLASGKGRGRRVLKKRYWLTLCLKFV